MGLSNIPILLEYLKTELVQHHSGIEPWWKTRGQRKNNKISTLSYTRFSITLERY
jgi:hypothetical protein